MPASVVPVHHHPFPMADITQQQQQQQTRYPLRRAVYVHVSDLTNAYNIDHPKLEQELAKVKEGTQTNDENAIPEEEEREEVELTATAAAATGCGDGDSSSVTSATVQAQQNRRKSLHPPRAGFNLCVLVGKVKIVVDKLRVDRSRVRLAEVEVGDETGLVSLRARDDQIEALQRVSERGGAVVLRNCSVELFQGKYIRLAVTKWGKLTPYPDNIPSTPPPPTKMNRDRNFSLIDLSLVASELVEMSPSEAAFSPQAQYRMLDSGGRRVERQQVQTPRQQQFQHMHQSRPERKYSRDRRQQRQMQGGMPSSRGARYPESGMQQGAHMGSLRYPALPAFSPSLGDSMDHFGSPGRGHGHSHQANTQHLLMQQYEMHQRQLQQMHAFHEQQERAGRPMMQPHQHAHQMQPSAMMVGGSPSFDTSADYSVSSPVSGPGQSMHLVGNNPMLIRVSMPGGQLSQAEHYASRSPSSSTVRSSASASSKPEAFRPYARVVQEQAQGSFVAVRAGEREASSEAWTIPPASSFVSKDDPTLSPGHMNPQATSFAPSAYQKDVPMPDTHMQPSYGYYDPSTAGTMYSPSAAYNQNIMYVPAVSGSTATTSTEPSPETKDSEDRAAAAAAAAPQKEKKASSDNK